MQFYHKNLQAPNIDILKKSLLKYSVFGFTIHSTGISYQHYIDNGIRRLATFQSAWKSQLNKANVETLFDLLYRCPAILTNPQQASRAAYRIRSMIQRRTNMTTMPNFTLSFPYDHRVDAIQLKRIVSKLLDNTRVTNTIRQHISLQLRIVNTRRKTISDILTNAKHACSKFDPNKPPKCIKHPT